MLAASARATPLVLLLSLLVIAVSAAAGGTPASRTITVEGGGRYTEVSPPVLRAMLGRNHVLLVNVHVPYAGEIPGTDRFIPYDQIVAGRAKLAVRKDAPMILYCRSGRMSEIAARALVKVGYTHVVILAGGMEAWEDAGLAIVRGRHVP